METGGPLERIFNVPQSFHSSGETDKKQQIVSKIHRMSESDKWQRQKQRKGGEQKGLLGSSIVNKVFRESLTEKVTLDQRPERGKNMTQVSGDEVHEFPGLFKTHLQHDLKFLYSLSH